MLKNRGHWAVFELGTVYLYVSKESYKKKAVKVSVESVLGAKYTRYKLESDGYYITTNYRVICQLGLEDFMKNFWSEPIDGKHYIRVTSHWICSRSTSHQLVRSRVFSYIQASQRYINYGLEKNGSGITYILPQWVYQLREAVGSSIHPKTRIPNYPILKLDGSELWEALADQVPVVKRRDALWKMAEDEYKLAISTFSQKPEDARGMLLNDTATELCMCGFLEDYIGEPDPEKTTEKFGFFYLRCAPDAQADIRVLAKDLKKQFKEAGLIK